MKVIKDQENKERYNLYLQGYSLSQIGKIYNLSRQSIYDGFKRRGFKLRTKTRLPFFLFNKKKFTLCNNGYYRQTDGDRELMHRYVWKYYNKDIPEGYDIHHKDSDSSNNNFENLELISHTEHAKKYSTGNNQYVKNGKRTRNEKEII